MNNYIKLRVNFEKIVDFKISGYLYSPREDPSGMMYTVSNGGEICYINEGAPEQIETQSQLSCICFDDYGGIYLGDTNVPAIYYKTSKFVNLDDISETVLVKDFEDIPLKGPTSMAYSKNTNTLYITDGGIMDSAELYPKTGSLFAIDLDTKVMKVIMRNNLSYPADVIYDNVNDCLYLAETLENRVLRINNKPYGVLNASVYCQFNGRFGPNAIALDDSGYLFVARYEYPTESYEGIIVYDGIITVLNSEGVPIGDLILENAGEITGLYYSPKVKECLFFTEKNMNGIFKIRLSAFYSEIEKINEIRSNTN